MNNKKNKKLKKTVLIGAPVVAALSALSWYLAKNQKYTKETLRKKNIESLQKINDELIIDLQNCKEFFKFKEIKKLAELQVLRNKIENFQKGGFFIYDKKENLIRVILEHQDSLIKCKQDLKKIEDKYKNTEKSLKENINFFQTLKR